MLSAMLALKEYIPLSESFLLQLDLEGMGLTAMGGKLPSYSTVEGQMVCFTLLNYLYIETFPHSQRERKC
jgi:hypothetical protein